MSKYLCKFSRREIGDNLGVIHSLVSEAKYVCRSCARSSLDQSRLCKPAVIPSIPCQSKSTGQKKPCTALADTLPQSQQHQAVEQKMAKKAQQKSDKKKKQYKKGLKKLAKISKKRNKLLKKLEKLDKEFSQPFYANPGSSLH